MNCYKPLRIKNQYNGNYLHVNCRNCDACKVLSANQKACELSQTLRQYDYKYFITLTYDNDHVPYIIPNMMAVFRGQTSNDFAEVIGYLDEPVEVDLDYKYLVNHDTVGAVGVLWYYDVQCFFKRFRKYINKHYGKRDFKYTAVGEYGSFYGRPHYHIVIYSNTLLFDECKAACFESWSYHDWHRFWKNGENEACKRCTESCGAYIASYVTCNTNNVQISNYKQFRQKTWRSKNIYYGLDTQLLETYKEDVIRIATGDVSEGNRKLFYYLQNTQKDNVSFRLLSARYISSCFHKFKGWNEISFSTKLARAYDIIGRCQRLRKAGKSLGEYNFIASIAKGTGVKYVVEQKSDDLSFYRGYVRFNYIFRDYVNTLLPKCGYKDLQSYESRVKTAFISIYDYLVLMDKVLKYYASCLLYEQMKSFETLGKDNYYLSLIDTCVEVPEKRPLMLLRKMRALVIKNNNINCPPMIRHSLDCYVQKYKSKLLVKHFNDKNNILYR